MYQDRGTISISLDGDPATTLNCFLNTSSEVVTRRILRKSVPRGTHAVTLMLQNSQPFVFDYVEAAVTAENIGDAVVTYDEVSPALDFDTDATYKMSPQRLLWHLQKLGFRGQLNEYLGVFWWNQRKRAGGAWNSAVVAFGGVWGARRHRAALHWQLYDDKNHNRLGHSGHDRAALCGLHQLGQRLHVGRKHRQWRVNNSHSNAKLGRHVSVILRLQMERSPRPARLRKGQMACGRSIRRRQIR